MNTSEKFTSRHGHWITPVFIALAFYGIGAAMMDSFVVYHTWKFVGESEFSTMHKESGSRIVPFFVLPMLLMTVFLILQFWHRPISITRKHVWAMLICTIIPWLSSAFIQIPMQVKLDNGKDQVLLQQLISTDWIRVIPSWILAVLVFAMIKGIISK